MIKFNKKAWLKPYIDINTVLRKATKSYFVKDFLKLINSSFFGKTTEYVRKHRDIKFVTTEKGRNYLVSEPNYHITKFSTENLLAILMNKLVFLGLLIIDLSKTVILIFGMIM